MSDTNQEIIEAVQRELAAAGVHGKLLIVRGAIELRESVDAVPLSIDITSELQQWALLPTDHRERKAQGIASRLYAVRKPRKPLFDVGDTKSWTKAAKATGGLFGALLVIGIARMVIARVTSSPDPVATAQPSEPEGVRAERLARACEAVRERIRTSGNFGPFALEGFVVELWLGAKGGPDLRTHPAVTGLVTKKRLAPAADEKLAEILGGEVAIADGLDASTAARWQGWKTARIEFRDGLGRAFFEDEHRPRFISLADRVARETGATYATLTARCAHQTAPAVGAWFRGPDVPGAAAAMVFRLGVLADDRVIDGKALRELQQGSEMDGLIRDAAKVEDMLPRVVGAAGGSLLSPPPTIQFGLASASRSIAATRDLARALGIAPPGD